MSDFEHHAAGQEARRSLPHRAWRPDEEHRQEALQRYLRAVASAAPPEPARPAVSVPEQEVSPPETEHPAGSPEAAPRVRDVMTVPAVSVPRDMAYLDIVRTLSREHLSAVPVVEGDQVVGVVSESDLLAKAAVESTGRRSRLGRRREHRLQEKSRGETAATLMTSPAVTVRPGIPVAEAAWTAARSRLKRLPVTDHLGRLVGVVSRRDLLRALVRNDDDIRQDIVSRILREHFLLPAGSVEVAVTNGVVTLHGSGPAPEVVPELLDEIRSIDDVVDVIDRTVGT
ncbi:CBS domain-containing protein [Streptomyces meridianus]|uniref:CBS domain-containing protein n=1 Tax=Streptomyces meridianus TaxID=2938945 RepID=A0ABT0XB71_9ACTN|nr:CBS domain-containing protein [Streptomyces meridianus]MCM2579757.1 CBS domain-containing protein [Streptomyces meridianus]